MTTALVSLHLSVNGEPTEAAFAPYKTLLEVLREDLNLCGTKHGCELGECGACAVLLDGQPVLSCLVLGVDCGGRTVTTVEGLVTDGRLHPLQETFADLGAAQCGYCTPGFLVTAKALLDDIPHPSRDQIKEALSGCLCRCTGYQQIFEAVEAAVDYGATMAPPVPGTARAAPYVESSAKGEADARTDVGRRFSGATPPEPR
jgi:carbon-monoxide dehydrogenase small subunit